MKKNITIELRDGSAIQAIHQKPEAFDPFYDKLLVLIVNGFPKHKTHTEGFFNILASEIQKMGHSTLQFDFTHSNEKSLETEKLSFKTIATDMDILLSWAKTQGYEDFAFVTEGLGASFAFMNAPEKIKCSILFWPAFNFQNLVHTQFRTEENTIDLQTTGFIEYAGTKIGQQFISDLTTTDPADFLTNIKSPILVLCGENDEIMPMSHTEFACKHLASKRIDITTFQGGTHGLENNNHRESCLHLSLDFIRKYTQF